MPWLFAKSVMLVLVLGTVFVLGYLLGKGG
jgi:hypothetical protein